MSEPVKKWMRTREQPCQAAQRRLPKEGCRRLETEMMTLKLTEILTIFSVSFLVSGVLGFL